jgi:hypothetical protein
VIVERKASSCMNIRGVGLTVPTVLLVGHGKGIISRKGTILLIFHITTPMADKTCIKYDTKWHS